MGSDKKNEVQPQANKQARDFDVVDATERDAGPKSLVVPPREPGQAGVLLRFYPSDRRRFDERVDLGILVCRPRDPLAADGRVFIIRLLGLDDRLELQVFLAMRTDVPRLEEQPTLAVYLIDYEPNWQTAFRPMQTWLDATAEVQTMIVIEGAGTAIPNDDLFHFDCSFRYLLDAEGNAIDDHWLSCNELMRKWFAVGGLRSRVLG